MPNNRMVDKKKIHPLDAANFPWYGLIKYRGVTVEKVGKFYKLWGRMGLDADGVDRVIDESLKSLMKSISK